MEGGKHLNKPDTFLPSMLLCKLIETVQYASVCACMWGIQAKLSTLVLRNKNCICIFFFTDQYIFVNHEYANDECVHANCSQAPKMIAPSSSARVFFFFSLIG